MPLTTAFQAEPVIRAKKSNKVRPSSVNYVDSFPPRGSLEAADNFCRIILLCGKSAAPHQSTTLTASPRGEALKRADNFQQARGSL